MTMTKKEATKILTSHDFWEKKPTSKEVKECIDAGADLSACVGKGMNEVTILSEAARFAPEAIDVLIAAGADINQKTADGMTSIQLACMGNTTADVLQKLVEHGADVHYKSPNTGFDSLGWLLREGSEITTDNGMEKLEVLLKAGINPNSNGTSREWGATPLDYVAISMIEEDKKLNRYNVPLQYKNIQLFLKYDSVLELLLKYGADIHYKHANNESFYSQTASKVPFVEDLAEAVKKGKKGIDKFFEDTRKKVNEVLPGTYITEQEAQKEISGIKSTLIRNSMTPKTIQRVSKSEAQFRYERMLTEKFGPR